MKKRSFLTVMVSFGILLGGMIFFENSKEPDLSKVKVATAQAAYESFDSLEELENDADLIALVTFTGERVRDDIKVTDTKYIPLSKSTVKIEKLYKGDENVNDHIYVYEEAAVDKNTYVNTEGYKWMDESGRYLLFLHKLSNFEGYNILGIYQGKYNMNVEIPKQYPNTTEGNRKALLDRQAEYLGNHPRHFRELKKMVMEKYSR
ncbi:MAG TPA: hypothetical protein VFV52_16585 [Bacilli bacterium]|nr:hypothetical protein [Bacilli bacterium]